MAEAEGGKEYEVRLRKTERERRDGEDEDGVGGV